MQLVLITDSGKTIGFMNLTDQNLDDPTLTNRIIDTIDRAIKTENQLRSTDKHNDNGYPDMDPESEEEWIQRQIERDTAHLEQHEL